MSSLKKHRISLIVQAILILISLFLSPEKPALALEGRLNLNIDHARGFTVEKSGDLTIVRLQDPYPGANSPVEYLLVPRGAGMPSRTDGATVIEVPLRTCVSTTTVNIAFLRELELSETLVGQGGKKYVYSPDEFEKALPETGEGMNLDLEKVLELDPDAIFAYAFSPTERDNLKRLEKLGVPVIFMSEHLEDTPLGRSEWIKYLSLFFGQEEKAAQIFSEISRNYEALAKKVSSIDHKPEVMANAALNGTWYVPAGDNWVAHLFRDAGASYPWSSTQGEGSLALDLEAVCERSVDSNVWVNTGSWEYLDDAIGEDERYAWFKPFKKGSVYNNTARCNDHGGNDYHQSGVLRADLVLADLVSIFHPSILPGHSLMYYRKLDWK